MDKASLSCVPSYNAGLNSSVFRYIIYSRPHFLSYQSELQISLWFPSSSSLRSLSLLCSWPGPWQLCITDIKILKKGICSHLVSSWWPLHISMPIILMYVSVFGTWVGEMQGWLGSVTHSDSRSLQGTEWLGLCGSYGHIPCDPHFCYRRAATHIPLFTQFSPLLCRG